MLDWLEDSVNCQRYLTGIKSDACKKLAVYLEEMGVSEVIRSWKAIKNRLKVMMDKYKLAVERKNSTGYGTKKNNTIQGS